MQQVCRSHCVRNAASQKAAVLAHAALAVRLAASEHCVRAAVSASQEDSAKSAAQHKYTHPHTNTHTHCTDVHLLCTSKPKP